MEVVKVVPRGYCKGVVQAIKIAKECAVQYKGQPIYILGMIVHNSYIVEALKNLNVQTIDEKGKTRLELLDKIDEGVVIITAHGAGEDVFNKAKAKGLTVVDATCKDVIKTHELIKSCIQNNQEVLYIGKKGHPESEGALSINKKVHLIESIKDLENYKDQDTHYVITNQTTMSLYDVATICEKAKSILNNVEIAKETCNATTIRQQAMKQLDKDIDILYVVGDPRSNNSNRLSSIAKQYNNLDVYMIETINDINIEDLKGKQKVAVTAGASTPTILTNQVINYLSQFEYENISTHTKQPIPYEHILD